jgi:hypothetical protein
MNPMKGKVRLMVITYSVMFQKRNAAGASGGILPSRSAPVDC